MSLRHLNRRERRAASRYLEEANAAYGPDFVEIPRSQWPDDIDRRRRKRVLRNRWFLVQLFDEDFDIVRISVNRTALDETGRWSANISWDELQAIKDAIGYADRDAVEVYPAKRDIVNVANMRHLWVLPQLLRFPWRSA